MKIMKILEFHRIIIENYEKLIIHLLYQILQAFGNHSLNKKELSSGIPINSQDEKYQKNEK